jgi:hypothetical protein
MPDKQTANMRTQPSPVSEQVEDAARQRAGLVFQAAVQAEIAAAIERMRAGRRAEDDHVGGDDGVGCGGFGLGRGKWLTSKQPETGQWRHSANR